MARIVDSDWSMEQTTRSWLPACVDLCVAFDTSVLSKLPDDFQSRVWPSYVQALQHPSYWLDASELVLLAALANLNVAVCLCCGSRLKLVDQYLQDVIFIKIHGGRGHFERVEVDSGLGTSSSASGSSKLLDFLGLDPMTRSERVGAWLEP